MKENFPILNKVIDQINDILEEEKVGKKTYTISPKRILEMAEEGRMKRSKDIKLLVVEKRGSGKNYKRYEFEAESKEKSESNSHIGYVELMKRGGNVHSFSCSCSDHASRFHTINTTKHNIGNFSKSQEIGFMNEYFDPHNKDMPVIMNSEDDLGYACKHILGVLSKIEDNNLVVDEE